MATQLSDIEIEVLKSLADHPRGISAPYLHSLTRVRRKMLDALESKGLITCEQNAAPDGNDPRPDTVAPDKVKITQAGLAALKSREQ